MLMKYIKKSKGQNWREMFKIKKEAILIKSKIKDLKYGYKNIFILRNWYHKNTKEFMLNFNIEKRG